MITLNAAYIVTGPPGVRLGPFAITPTYSEKEGRLSWMDSMQHEKTVEIAKETLAKTPFNSPTNPPNSFEVSDVQGKIYKFEKLTLKEFARLVESKMTYSSGKEEFKTDEDLQKYMIKQFGFGF